MTKDTYIKTAGINPAKEENNILLGTIPFEGNEFLTNLFEKVRARKEQGLDPNPYLVDRGQVNWIFDKFQYQDNVVVVGVTNPVGIAQYDDYYRQVVILVDGKISAKIHKGWKNTGHSVEILDNYQFIIKLISLDELVEVHSSKRDKWAVPVYRAKNDDLIIDYIPSSGLIWSSDRLLSQTLSTILELYWKDLDWSKPFQWAIVGSKHYNTEFFLFGSRNSVMAINKCHNIILLFVKGEIYRKSYGRDDQWFHLEKDLEQWIKDLPEGVEDIEKYIPAEIWDEHESLDYVREFISCIKLYRKPSPENKKGNLEKSNSLPTSRLRPEEYSDSVFNLLTRGTGKDSSYETPFSWGTDMQGKILVSSNAFVKEEWADKVVFFRETFRKQAPDERSFFKGNLNVEDILEKGSPIVYSMEINGKPSFGGCSLYTTRGYIYVNVPSFGKVILSNEPYDKEAYDLPKIDWVRTYQVNKDLTVAGLLSGRFYFWMKGDNSDNDRHSLVKTSVWMADYLSTK